MEIISLKFAILTIVSVFLLYAIPSRLRLGYLVLLSSGFIATYNIFLPIYIAIYSFINFIIGQRIPFSRNKKTLFRTGIIINLTQLLFLRYASFAIDPFLSLFNSNLKVSVLSEIILPLGISYYTLQGIGYLINIKMGWEKPDKHFLSFLLYIIFFPKFLSGPIERSNHFLPQITRENEFNPSNITEGFRTALLGFFKKIVIANQLAPIVTNAYANIENANELSIFILVVLQPLYLYFDFSGYTDIAIGFSKALGIDLLPNFNKPFFSENMTTFWKRFHISLSSWFNDYVFRRASFKRRKWGVYASVYALLITWTLFGIWHGAGWNFMLLGLVQALAIIFEFFTKKWRINLFSRMPDTLNKWISRFLTYLFYSFSLTFFFSPDLRTSLTLFGSLFGISKSLLAVRIIPFRELIQPLVFIIIILAVELLENDFKDLYTRLKAVWIANKKQGIVLRLATYYILMTLIFVYYKQTQEFIYFQF